MDTKNLVKDFYFPLRRIAGRRMRPCAFGKYRDAAIEFAVEETLTLIFGYPRGAVGAGGAVGVGPEGGRGRTSFLGGGRGRT